MRHDAYEGNSAALARGRDRRTCRNVHTAVQGQGATEAPAGFDNLTNGFGSNLFDAIGCNVCHTRSITTASVGTSINGGALIVPAALGNKIIHPFSDFLLHDIGTGDGVVQNGGQSTANKLRTQPLWGVRTHDRHMHDGATLTFNESILRHAGEARGVIASYRSLSSTQQNQLITFLKSLERGAARRRARHGHPGGGGRPALCPRAPPC